MQCEGPVGNPIHSFSGRASLKRELVFLRSKCRNASPVPGLGWMAGTRLRQQQQGCPVQKWNICLEMMMMMVVVLVKLEEARKGKM